MMTGEAEKASTLLRPWADVSKAVSKPSTVAEAMKAGSLDWDVVMCSLVTADEARLEIPEHFATVKQDTQTILGVVGSQYTIIQNRDAFSFFDHALSKGSATIEAVGSIDDDRRVFAVAKLPEIAEILPGDTIEHYILLVTSHDGSSALQAVFTPTRTLCQNMVFASIKTAKQSVRLKHTKNVSDSIKIAHSVVNQGNAYWLRIQGAFRYMATREADKARLTEVLQELFPSKIDSKSLEMYTPSQTLEVRNRIEALFDGQAAGAPEAGHTDWGIYNAITYYIDHERNNRVGSRWESSVFGTGVAIRQRAFDILVRS